MAFRILPDGAIETSSIDEAIALSARLRTAVPSTPTTPVVRAITLTGDAEKIRALKARLAGRRDELTFLDFVGAAGELGIASTELADKVSTDLPKVIAAVCRVAKRIGLASSDIIRRDITGWGKSRVVQYKAGPALRDFVHVTEGPKR